MINYVNIEFSNLCHGPELRLNKSFCNPALKQAIHEEQWKMETGFGNLQLVRNVPFATLKRRGTSSFATYIKATEVK